MIYWGLTTNLFQSTLPVGGATSVVCFRAFQSLYFNPRSPWGERLPKFPLLITKPEFQSTLPVGGATAKMHRFSVHFWRGLTKICGSSPKGPWVPSQRSKSKPNFGQNFGANLAGKSVRLDFALKPGESPPADRCSCSRNAPPSSHSDSPGNRSAGCLSPGP